MKPRSVDAPLKMLRTGQVLALLNVSRPTLWAWRRRGLFPAPRRVGPNVIAWPEAEVAAWLESRPVAGPVPPATRG